MTESVGSLSLVGGSLALDFVNTAAGRDTPEPFEHLRVPVDLVDWAVHAGGIATGGPAERSYAAMERDADAAENLLRHARDLREAIYAVGAAIAHGRTPPDPALAAVKDYARRAMAPAELAPIAEDGYRLDFSQAPTEFALLGPVAWSAIDLLREGEFDRLKQCSGDGCGWLFFDRSKNNSRRWCDMATCGNRSKVTRHRHRH